jgi:YggT family protein
MILLISAINGFAQVLIYLLIGRAICSWFVRGRSGTGYKIYNVLTMLTEPIVAPCRKITQRFPTGILDISVLLAFLLVMVVRDVLIRVLLMFV